MYMCIVHVSASARTDITSALKFILKAITCILKVPNFRFSWKGASARTYTYICESTFKCLNYFEPKFREKSHGFRDGHYGNLLPWYQPINHSK